jgi:nicotinate-nucleotide pyrophosphorylase (carboxylating)
MVRAALQEDAAHADATVAFVGLSEAPVRADIRTGQDAVVAGVEVAREVFAQLDAGVQFGAVVGDGARVAAGGEVIRVSGSARAIVSAERTALNFLQRMSGVATLAARYVAAVAGTGVTILDTRKTAPLWRELDKYAVRCGGASNHRTDLNSMVLIKENHVRAAGGSAALLARIAQSPRPGFVELEVDSAEFLDELLEAPASDGIDRVMLDNFSPEQVRVAVARIARWREARAGRRLQVEVSGGIVLDTVRNFALPGVDFISIGALTHSAPAVAMSLEIIV